MHEPKKIIQIIFILYISEVNEIPYNFEIIQLT